MLNRPFACLLAAAFCLPLARPARAGAPAAPATASAPLAGPAFQKGATELELDSGFELSLQHTHLRVTNFDYELTILRAGYMIDSARGHTFLRGNDEFMLEVEGGPVFHGYGSALGGLSVVYRRNFLLFGPRVVPYLDLGLGGVYSDAYHDKVQRSLGGKFEFDCQVGFGFRFRITPRWSANAEFDYRHLSDAFITERNLGTNGVGGAFGVSRSF